MVCLLGGLTMSKRKINQMIKYITLLLFIGLAWGQQKNKNPFWEGLILKKGKKIEYVEIGEKVVLYYQNSAEYGVQVKIKGVTKDKIKLYRNDNRQTLEVNYRDISRIDRNVRPNKAFCSFSIIGSLIAGGYVASIGNWDNTSDAFAGMIITPIVATIGGGIGGILGILVDIQNKNNIEYLIEDGEWRLSTKQKQSLLQFALPSLYK